MDSLSPPETRGRSRSNTPFLRSSCDSELCAHAGEDHIHERKRSPLKRSPFVHTIIEEVVVKNTQNRQAQTVQQRTSKMTTSDYQTTTSNISHSFGNRSIGNKQNSFNMHQSGSSAKSKEISQNELNSAFENSQAIQTSTPIFSMSKKIHASNTTNGDLSSHMAYKEYREAGEYWKKFPKTDYTYSKLSPHRRELAPGIVAMPNMSRPSLDKHQERVNYLIQQNPAQEEYIRKRYAYDTTTNYQETRNKNFSQSQALGYDSQDEVDLTDFRKYRNTRAYTLANVATSTHNTNFVSRTTTKIVTLFSTFLSLFWNSEDKHLYYSRIEQQQQGFFGRIKSAISSAILSVFRYIYLLISSVLYLDTWLLRSSSPNNRNKKRFLLFLLILLPLLLLTGIYYYLNPPETFPPKSFSQLPSLTFSSVNLSEYVNPKQVEYFKMSAFEKIDDLKTWSDDYFTYLKTVSHNVLTEAHKIWLENFNN